jgi:hypothetical protein
MVDLISRFVALQWIFRWQQYSVGLFAKSLQPISSIFALQ